VRHFSVQLGPAVIFIWMVGVVAVLFAFNIANWGNSPHQVVASSALLFLGYVTITNYLRGRLSRHFSRAIFVLLFAVLAITYYLVLHRVIDLRAAALLDFACVGTALYLRIKFPPTGRGGGGGESHPGWISFHW